MERRSNRSQLVNTPQKQPPVILEPPSSEKDFTSKLELVPIGVLNEAEQMPCNRNSSKPESTIGRPSVHPVKNQSGSGDVAPHPVSEPFSPRRSAFSRKTMTLRESEAMSQRSKAPEFARPMSEERKTVQTVRTVQSNRKSFVSKTSRVSAKDIDLKSITSPVKPFEDPTEEKLKKSRSKSKADRE